MSVAMGMPQPRLASPPPAMARKMMAGSDRASDRGHDGQRGPADRGQLTDQDLALDLEADHQEEDGHQAVVDPVEQRLREAQGAEGQA